MDVAVIVRWIYLVVEGVGWTLIGLLNPFKVFGPGYPSINILSLAASSGEILLHSIQVAKALIVAIRIVCHVQFAVSSYQLRVIVEAFEADIALPTSCVDYWNEIYAAQSTSERQAPSALVLKLKNWYHKLVPYLPTIQIQIKAAKIIVNSKFALNITGFDVSFALDTTSFRKLTCELTSARISYLPTNATELSITHIQDSNINYDNKQQSAKLQVQEIGLNPVILAQSHILDLIICFKSSHFLTIDALKARANASFDQLLAALTAIEHEPGVMYAGDLWAMLGDEPTVWYDSTPVPLLSQPSNFTLGIVLSTIIIGSVGAEAKPLVIHDVTVSNQSTQTIDTTTGKIEQDVITDIKIAAISDNIEQSAVAADPLIMFKRQADSVWNPTDIIASYTEVESITLLIAQDFVLPIYAHLLRSIVELVPDIFALTKPTYLTLPVAKAASCRRKIDINAERITVAVVPDEVRADRENENQLLLIRVAPIHCRSSVDTATTEEGWSLSTAGLAVSYAIGFDPEEREDASSSMLEVGPIELHSSTDQTSTEVIIDQVRILLSAEQLLNIAFLLGSLRRNIPPKIDSGLIERSALQLTPILPCSQCKTTFLTVNSLSAEVTCLDGSKFELSDITGITYKSTSGSQENKFEMAINSEINASVQLANKDTNKRNLLRIFSTNPDSHVIAVTSRKTRHASIVSHELGVMVGYAQSNTAVGIDTVVLNLDVLDLQPLYMLETACHFAYPHATTQADEMKRLFFGCHEVIFTPEQPTSLMFIGINKLKASFYHHHVPTVVVCLEAFELGQLSYHGSVSQMSITLTDLHLSELTQVLAAHKVIIDSPSAGYRNRLSLHISSAKGECGLVEVTLEQARVTYLQRATMTLVTFFRDHFFGSLADMRGAIPRPKRVIYAAPNGIFRLAVLIRKSEFHMPASSGSSDALVVLFRRLSLYRSTQAMEAIDHDYCLGPLLRKRLWISRLASIRAVCLDGETDIDFGVKDLLHELVYDGFHPPPSLGLLNITLKEGLVTSWCNSNVITTSQHATCTIKIWPASPNAEDPPIVIDTEEFHEAAMQMRNTIIVSVDSDEVDWIMAQGQYWLIVNSIQQNFQEPNIHVIDPFILPVIKKVDLKESIYGSDPLFLNLPLASSVPLLFKRGRIIAAENDPEFFECFTSFMPEVEEVTPEHLYDAGMRFMSKIPTAAAYHVYRDNLFSRWTSHHHTTQREAKRERMMHNNNIDTPFGIIFEELKLDFYRFHFGGGNGIECSAGYFVVQEAHREGNVEEVYSNVLTAFDDLDINDIILAPRSCRLFAAAATATAEATYEDRSKEKEPHIRYSQQGVANLRRCVITVNDTCIVGRVAAMLSVVDFFVLPIQVTGQRNLQLVESKGRGPFDYRQGLDVELHVNRSYLCFTGNPSNEASDSNDFASEGLNALCFDIKIDLLQALRGFLNVGPGCATMTIDIAVINTFMAPLNEVDDVLMKKPLVDPVQLVFRNYFTVQPRADHFLSNHKLLHTWMTFERWSEDIQTRFERGTGRRQMAINVLPLAPDQTVAPEEQDFSSEAKSADTIYGRCSVKDLLFILSAVNIVRRSIKRRLLNAPKGDAYRTIVQNVPDMMHLLALDEILICAPLNYDLKVDVKESIGTLSNFDFLLRNNTYNVDILRLKLYNIFAEYTRSPEQLYMATGTRLDLWSYHDELDEWEPLIEPISMRAIGATDASKGTATLSVSTASKIRVEVDTEGLEINANQGSLTSFLRKLRLGDVITTSSSRLPPYMLVNELGIACKFAIGLQGIVILESDVEAGRTLPIEVAQLASSLNSYKMRRRYASNDRNNANIMTGGSNKEYLIWISFMNLSHDYEARVPLSIDQVGVQSFDMRTASNRVKLQSNDGDERESKEVKFLQETPLAILHMKIKDDGVRELHLRGWLSFKNSTSRLMQLALRLYGSSLEMSLPPEKEWHVPVRYANPKAALYVRFGNTSSWIEVMPALGNLVAGGAWGNPSKLRASVCRCYREYEQEANNSNNNAEAKWLMLLRPEVKAVGRISSTGGISTSSSSSKQQVSIRYPTRETHLKNTKAALGMAAEDIDMGLDEAVAIKGTTFSLQSESSPTQQGIIRPILINLQAPLQLCNYLPQPLLYRLVDMEGSFCASGLLLPGQRVDVHHIPQLFYSRLLISIRMLNYGWSNWEVVCSRSAPFSINERSVDLTLPSLLFHGGGNGNKDFSLPQLTLNAVIKEFFIRFTCPVVISNFTGQELLFAEASKLEESFAIASYTSVKDIVDPNTFAAKQLQRNNRITSVAGRGVKSSSYTNLTLQQQQQSVDENDSNSNNDDNESNNSDERTSFSHLPPPFSSSQPSSSQRFTQIKNLVIHMPQDHQKIIEVVASTSWTLEDLFQDVKHRIASNGVDLLPSDFKFFAWVLEAQGQVHVTVDEDSTEQAQQQEKQKQGKALQKQASFTAASVDMPQQMRFDLAISLQSEPLPMHMSISSLSLASTHLLLCHEVEYTIWKQIKTIRTESVASEGFASFFKSNKQVYRATLSRIIGDFPFRPYKLLGSPLLSITVPAESDWSHAIDVNRGDFDGGEMVIALSRTKANSKQAEVNDDYNPLYEFGMHLERGNGLNNNIIIATVVPKHILISKLSYAIDIRQMDHDYTPSLVFLPPGGACNFHFPNKFKVRLLQVRRSPVFLDSDASSSNEQLGIIKEEVWTGEVDITTLGIVYIRLKNPLAMIKVETEVVGGSLVATFKEQSLIWPPYRIDNKSTNAMIRFKQEKDGTAGSSNAGGSLDLLSSLNNLTNMPSMISNDKLADISNSNSPQQQQPQAGAGSKDSSYDIVEAGHNLPYTWDYPFSGRQTISLELSTPYASSSKSICLDDDDLKGNNSIVLKKNVPNLGNPLAEGYLTRVESVMSGVSERLVYCILRPDVLYIYENESRTTLVDIISMTTVKASKQQSQQNNGKRLVMTTLTPGEDAGSTASKEKGFLQELFTTITTTGNNLFLKQRTKTKYDINYVRMLMVKIAEYLDIFGYCSLEQFKVVHRPPPTPANIDADAAHLDNSNHDNSVGLTLESRSMSNSTESLSSLLAAVPPPILLPNGGGGEVNRGSDATTTTPRGSGSNPSNNTASNNHSPLKELLAAGVTIEQLLEVVQRHPISTQQVIDALLFLQEEKTVDGAKELCAWLILHEYLVPYDSSVVIRALLNPANTSSEVEASEDNSRASMMLSRSRATLSMRSTPKASATPSAASIAASTAVSYNAIMNECESMEMIFQPPPLNIELTNALLVDATSSPDGGDGGQAAAAAATDINAKATAVAASCMFTLSLDNHLKLTCRCTSDSEFYGWMMALRLSIELGFVDFTLDKKSTFIPHVKDYQTTYHLKTRADGSTRVLEITEEGVSSSLVQSTNNNNLTKSTQNKGLTKIADAFSFLPAFRSSKSSKRAKATSSVASSVLNMEGIDPDRQLITVLFRVQSVSLSITDGINNSELLYLRLQEVEMGVIRYLSAVTFNVTVQQIQAVDQLLSPAFPVALFTRRLLEKPGGPGSSSSTDTKSGGILPSIQPSSAAGASEGAAVVSPSLHLHLQQRYHKSPSSQTANAINSQSTSQPAQQDNNKAKQQQQQQQSDYKLWYFDTVTLFIAPLHLGVDEEIIVRLYRYLQAVRTVITEETDDTIVKSSKGSSKASILANEFSSAGLEPTTLSNNITSLLQAGRKPYLLFAAANKRPLHLYFGLLTLHQIDLTFAFRPSPELRITNAEYALVSIVAQLDGARIKLHTLLAEHAFGSTVIIKEILAKHYRAAFWKQFRSLIGATDIVEGSVGLVANLGTGVYDLFNETSEGLINTTTNEKKTFLQGLSKGGLSLASHTIGGTSGFTSRIAGGVGRGISMLTLDTEFQRNRTYRKYNQAANLSEGLMVGTQELGRNIVEGVTGVVLSPYRGWESGGGVGLAVGMGKGILGVALKPAVGVLDLASRATEGLRNTTINSTQAITAEIEGIRRCRIPRAFGRGGLLRVYDIRAAAAQGVADYLCDFRQEPRLLVMAHLLIRRRILVPRPLRQAITTTREEEEDLTMHEAWGMAKHGLYLVLVATDRIVLVQLQQPDSNSSSNEQTQQQGSAGSKAQPLCKFIWSCPAIAIEQLASDVRGDLVLSLSAAACITGAWYQPLPTILEPSSRNYLTLQALLEQMLGPAIARMQPLVPPPGLLLPDGPVPTLPIRQSQSSRGLLQNGIRKKYSSGIRSVLMLAPTVHAYCVVGHVLYEYTAIASRGTAKDKEKEKEKASDAATKEKEGGEESEAQDKDKDNADSAASGVSPLEDYLDKTITALMSASPSLIASTSRGRSLSSGDDIDASKDSNRAISSGTPHTANGELLSPIELPDHFLSFVYPLVDLTMHGPQPEEGGKAFSISLQPMPDSSASSSSSTTRKMRTLRRDDPSEPLSEYAKAGLSLLFNSKEQAMAWRLAVESRCLLRPNDALPAGPLTTEDRRKTSRSLISLPGMSGVEALPPPHENSILSCLVLPTSGVRTEETETVKIEIARTLSAIRR